MDNLIELMEETIYQKKNMIRYEKDELNTRQKKLQMDEERISVLEWELVELRRLYPSNRKEPLSASNFSSCR